MEHSDKPTTQPRESDSPSQPPSPSASQDQSRQAQHGHKRHAGELSPSLNEDTGTQPRAKKTRWDRMEEAIQHYDWEAAAKRVAAGMAEAEAERKRRVALSPDGRLIEDGRKLQQKIEADPQMVVALEISASLRARCRANDDCMHLLSGDPSGNTIQTESRICIHNVENVGWFGRTKHYYHVLCFSVMIDLKSLLPSKFKMDGSSGRWPLMVEKWFLRQGCIDLEKIAAYLKERKLYTEKHSKFYSEWCAWSLAHRRSCENTENSCTCPPKPTSPTRPRLVDYTTEGDDCCTLLDVMEHEMGDELPNGWLEPPDEPEGDDTDGPAVSNAA